VGWEFAVIIDAGSTGSRVHVYRYYTSSSNNSPWAAVELPEAVHKTTPGLSSYAFNSKTAANSLQPLLKFAKEKVCQTVAHSSSRWLTAARGGSQQLTVTHSWC
jgi:Golgi nucleoside diphosphatase